MFKLLECDPQIPGLMAFERTVQALLEQFVQRGLGCAFGLLGFPFPKHTLLLPDGKRETQVVLDQCPEPASSGPRRHVLHNLCGQQQA
jgi:hypothetical protein